MQRLVPQSIVRSLVEAVTAMCEAVQKSRLTLVLLVRLMSNRNHIMLKVCVTTSVTIVVMSMDQVLVWEHGMVQIMEPHLVL